MCIVSSSVCPRWLLLLLIGAGPVVRAADLLAEGQPPKVGASADARVATPVRERTRSVVQSDREFLASIEALDPGQTATPAPAAETRAPSAPLTPAPSAPARSAERRSPLANSPPSVARPPVSSNVAPVAEETRPSSGEPESPLEQFVESYLDAAEQPSPDAELRFYAKEVDYFDRGKVSRRFIEKDQRSYYQRWPARKFKLLGPPTIRKVSDDGATVRYRLHYTLRGGNQIATGQTENVMRVKRTGSGWKIAGVRERKLRY